MSALTAKDVEALLLEHQFQWQIESEYDDTADWSDWDELFGSANDPEVFEVVGLGEVKVWSHDFGGIETNVSYLMFQIGDRIFRKEGLWVSHDGMYWDGHFSEVKPVQKVVTDYEVI